MSMCERQYIMLKVLQLFTNYFMGKLIHFSRRLRGNCLIMFTILVKVANISGYDCSVVVFFIVACALCELIYNGFSCVATFLASYLRERREKNSKLNPKLTTKNKERRNKLHVKKRNKALVVVCLIRCGYDH